MLTIAVLAGGKSVRMGKDKAVISFRGEMLIRRILEILANVAEEIFIVGPSNKKYHSNDIKIKPDLIPNRGPMGGLYTGLAEASHPAVGVVACDMPFVNAQLLAHQRDILFSENVDVVVPASARGLEPLHAVYRRETCLPAVKEAVDQSKERLISWYPKVKVRVLTQDEIKPFDPDGLIFLNINTPEELSRAENIEHDLLLPKTIRQD
jgi:molybdopterin-guanine dinucleotide biosynthesis protein A